MHDDGGNCIRITPAFAAKCAEFARKWANDLLDAASGLDSVTSVDNSHDPMEKFLDSLFGPYNFVDKLGVPIALAKMAGGVLGTSTDENPFANGGDLPIPDALRQMLQREATDFPSAEA